MRSISLSYLAITVFWCLCINISFAQIPGMTPSIHVFSGDTFEVGTDTKAIEPYYTWTLTRGNGEFVTAQRTRFFRARLTEVGPYMLSVAITDAQNTINELRNFSITVDELSQGILPPLPPVSTDSTPLVAILNTIPRTSANSTVSLPEEGGFIALDPLPSQGRITRYDIDLDTSIDSNGDSNTKNDQDTLHTISSLSGTPLYYYMLPSARRTIALMVHGKNGQVPSVIERTILFSGLEQPSLVPSSTTENASSMHTVQNPGSPIISTHDGSTIRFSVVLPDNLKLRQTLFLWDFGDQRKSLLQEPTHTYSTSGLFPVSLTVKDISNGAILFSLTDPISVTEKQNQSTVQHSSSLSSHASTSSGFSSSLPWKSIATVLLIVFLILLFALLLFGIIQYIKNRMGQKLADTLESIEQKIVSPEKIVTPTIEPLKLKKDGMSDTSKAVEKKVTIPASQTSTVVDVAPTKESSLTPEKDAITDREKEKSDLKQESLNTAPLAVATGPVPSWLNAAPKQTPISTPPVNNIAPISPTPPPPKIIPPSSDVIKKNTAEQTIAPKLPDTTVPPTSTVTSLSSVNKDVSTPPSSFLSTPSVNTENNQVPSLENIAVKKLDQATSATTPPSSLSDSLIDSTTKKESLPIAEKKKEVSMPTTPSIDVRSNVSHQSSLSIPSTHIDTSSNSLSQEKKNADIPQNATTKKGQSQPQKDTNALNVKNPSSTMKKKEHHNNGQSGEKMMSAPVNKESSINYSSTASKNLPVNNTKTQSVILPSSQKNIDAKEVSAPKNPDSNSSATQQLLADEQQEKTSSPQLSDNTPIAFIRAESVEDQQGKNTTK